MFLSAGKAPRMLYEKDILYECNDGAVMRKGIQCRLIIEK